MTSPSMDLGATIEKLRKEVESITSSPSSTLEELLNKRIKLLGYKPRGEIRKFRGALYKAMASCPNRDSRKKSYKAELIILRDFEAEIADSLDAAISIAKSKVVEKKDVNKSLKVEERKRTLSDQILKIQKKIDSLVI